MTLTNEINTRIYITLTVDISCVAIATLIINRKIGIRFKYKIGTHTDSRFDVDLLCCCLHSMTFTVRYL